MIETNFNNEASLKESARFMGLLRKSNSLITSKSQPVPYRTVIRGATCRTILLCIARLKLA